MRASSLRRTVDSIEMASITAPAAGRLPRFAKLRTFPRHERTPPMTEPTTPAKVAMPLHWKIGIGFFLGLVLGLVVYYTGLHEWTPVDLTSAACVAGEPAWYCRPVVDVIVHGITRPFGQLFLSLIFMLIVPLLFSALVTGVSEMGDIRSLGRIGWRTLGYTIGLSGIAVMLGLVLVNVFKPGAGVDPDLAAELLSEGAERSEEHTSELQSLMRISYAVFCLKKKNTTKQQLPMKK